MKAEYEALIEIGSPYYQFPDFDENAIATTFHTTGTTGGRKASFSAIGRSFCTRSADWSNMA